ncbi:hypothetical protein EDD37DRAFT_630115 [Exophiala viscosa]|uniref:Uncharacterized protein n=1 Tax=Exophiala viscosa TaxID=2486360 RepID=A0AAN6IEY3_9EURO|nr:hypothetical protein EDD36DRAFT_174370 [Exophiala viscosa]KAI1624067.1 hypothetical protein EDD37DRAFT_630115 [Exophiala viscosa]
MIPPTPTSPGFPLPSPRSPRSTAVEPGSAALSPVMTMFSPQQADQVMRSPLCEQRWLPTSSNLSNCRRNSLTTPVASPAQPSFMPNSPKYHLRTPERAYFQSLTSEPGAGRQSRMAMHSPLLTLPLRVNTSVAYPDLNSQSMAPISEEKAHTHIASTPLTTKMNWSPTSPSPSQRRMMRPHAPTPILTRRSPIRKKPRTKYHVTTLSPATLRTRAQYTNSLQHLRAPLVPLISVSNGLPHPQFPTTLLQYHLLTHDQLDSLARWYHQVDPPLDETFMYPAWIPAWTSLHPSHEYRNVVLDNDSTPSSHNVDLETKRRRFGRFIGLRGCESPTATSPQERPDELARRMEREWRRALERAQDEENAWEKSWRGRW